MFKFIKNLFGLGRKSDNVEVLLKGFQQAEIEDAIENRKTFKVFSPLEITLNRMKSFNSFILAYREAKTRFNNYELFGKISRNGRFTTDRNSSILAYINTHDEDIKICIEVFPTKKKTTGYNIYYNGSTSETQSNLERKCYDKDSLFTNVRYFITMTKLNG